MPYLGSQCVVCCMALDFDEAGHLVRKSVSTLQTSKTIDYLPVTSYVLMPLVDQRENIETLLQMQVTVLAIYFLKL